MSAIPTAAETNILIVDDEPAHAEATADALRFKGYQVEVAESGAAGISCLESQPFDLVITDLRLGDMDGLDIIRSARRIHPFIEVILLTGHGTIETAVEAMRIGAADYLMKPVDIQALRVRVAKALEGAALRRRTAELERTIDTRFGFEGIVGSSPKMHAIIQKMSQVAATDVSVLILGESGTGKELIAKSLHTNSRRKDKALVPLHCAALSEGVLESELFGHEKGAFTGADFARKGRFEHASGGSLFIDEVGDIPMSTQVKLLRVLEDRKIYRLGSNEPMPVDVRLITATNRNLQEMIAAKEFREDLFFRINVVSIEIPPLRERAIDIPLLVNSFLNDFTRIHQKKVEGISREALRMLTRYSWPGNVRELRNAVENMVVTSLNPILSEQDLPSSILQKESPRADTALPVGLSLRDLEQEHIRNTLVAVNGNRKKAAELLGIGERTLYRKITEYELRD